MSTCYVAGSRVRTANKRVELCIFLGKKGKQISKQIYTILVVVSVKIQELRSFNPRDGLSLCPRLSSPPPEGGVYR